MKIFTVYFVILILNVTEGAKILGVFPVPTPSHSILGSALMRALADKGHDVTIISAFPVKRPPPKKGSYREIIVEEVVAEHQRRVKDMSIFEMEDSNIVQNLPLYISMMLEMTERTLKDPKVQDLLHSGESFDVVIVEQALNEAHKGFAAHFNAPLVLLSTIGANTWVNMLNGNPAPTSYVADALLSYPSKMTLYERTANTFTHVFSHLLYNYYAFPKHKQIYDKYFPNGPDFYEVLYSGSIFLLNSHPSTNQPVPNVPNMIDIGGYHVQPAKTLPEDLQEFLDESKEGVIYFSMGSHLKSSLFPVEKRDAFLKTFSKLKQKVLWKWEEDVLPGQPKNVKLGKWLPQQEVLAHPNLKLFITHGGLLSTTETVYHGVPVLAIPIAGDQKMNAQQIVNLGFGLTLGYKQIAEETLTENLNELLTNTKYAENAKRRSLIFHDRQAKPIDTATYWVEYVIRHKGAPHLKVAGADLPWYKYMLLDVVGLIVVIALVVLYISFKVIRAIFSCGLSKKKPKQKRN